MKTKLITKFANTALLALVLAIAFVILFEANAIKSLIYCYCSLEIISMIVPKNVIGADVYADTVLQAARAFIKADNNRKFNLKPVFSTIMPIFTQGREYTIPELSSIRKATTQTTSALYMKKGSFSVGTAKTCAPTGQTSGSGKVDLTWATKNVEILSNYKQYQGNEVAQGMAFANDLYNAEVALWLSMETTLLAYLEANKSGVNNGGSGTFNTTYDIMSITNSNKSMFYNLVNADMLKNNYNPMYLEAHDTMWYAKQQQYINQGAGNSVNTEFQFAGFEFHPSNLITPGVIGNGTYDSIHYFVPTGGVVMLDWNDPLNRAGKVSGEKIWGTYQSLIHPEITFDLYKISGCADTTTSGGGTQDFVEKWELSLTYSLAKQPIETVDETPIYKYGTLTGDVYPT